MKTQNKQIRVLVVDDSSFMRKIISDLLDVNPTFKVIGKARNGSEAIEKAELLKPDVITLDVEMPIMNGLDALEIIIKRFHTPVVMVSSLTKDGAVETLRALEIGAVDFIEKPAAARIISGNQFKNDLYQKLKTASEANLKPLKAKVIENKKNSILFKTVIPKHNTMISRGDNGILAIAISTGGPKALQSVIPHLPAGFPLPVLVVQHMPPGFTKSLADRLDQTSVLHVKEAQNGEQIKPGTVYIAPGDYHMEVSTINNIQKIKLHQENQVNGHRPSADPMFRSLAKNNYDLAICVIMTGMGSDGTNGLKDLRKLKDCFVIAQDENSCVVFGMPKSAVLASVVDEVIPLSKITQAIVNRTGGL